MNQSHPFPYTRLGSSDDYTRYCAEMAQDLGARRSLENSMMTGGAPFTVDGFCAVCSKEARFEIDYRYAYEVEGVLTPNWREGLACPGCGLNNRMRATAHLVTSVLQPSPSSRFYLTERLTPVYEWVEKNFDHIVGSEFIGDSIPWGSSNAQGIRNEDLTKLSFDSESFDFVISLDVIEHVPRFERAFAELWRVLAPGGTLLFSVPFRMDLDKNLIRARVTDTGEIEHLLPPEYHGDPLNAEGCLSFYHFGWELLEQVQAAGFGKPSGLIFWSKHYGYLGPEYPLFIAKK